MDKITELNKWLAGAGKSAKWGIRILYLLAFGFYSYFMYFDKLFEGSRIPFFISFLAVLLVVPIAIFPNEWMLRWRIWRFANKQQVPVDSIPDGNKLAVTIDGKLLTFLASDKWKVKGTNAFFASGTIEKEMAPKEALSIHKETQEHLLWSNVVLAETSKLNAWFIAGNALLYALPQVREYPGTTTPDILFVLLFSTVFLLIVAEVRDGLTKHFFLGNKNFVITTENSEGENPQYALFDTTKTDAVLANARAEGLTMQLEAVTLNGGLLYAVSKGDVLVRHMIIEKD